jgi:hypothetical protein
VAAVSSSINSYICADDESQNTCDGDIRKQTDRPEWPTTKLDFAASSLLLVVLEQGISLRIDTRVAGD